MVPGKCERNFNGCFWSLVQIRNEPAAAATVAAAVVETKTNFAAV